MFWGILVIFMFQWYFGNFKVLEYFGHFLVFKSILVIFRFWGYFGHFFNVSRVFWLIFQYWGITQCENGTIKCEKKIREPLNVRKELLHVMLELHNLTMEPSNVRKKNKGTTEYDKRTITCKVGTT